jgi:hypothetical protein
VGFPHHHDDDDEEHAHFGIDPEAMHAWHVSFAQMQMEERQRMVWWAPMLCTCIAWYDFRYPGPPQSDCVIHTAIAMNPFTGEWM